ncbi:hypothetical protein BD410DRAFT_826570 [Rickenella mellea]|uniref:BTB domain-containing protein n=1 Tax=Rickenella mellea TaxID=50990 RepID=A0A4Y7QD00_9AGAM|nr:hypothetical protein BD410DRAFT_826570 [Rickenella mellea]
MPWEDIKSSDLWYFDGNLVVAATDMEEKKRYLFKVHKSVLASHSPIWKDIFDLPQAPATSKGDKSDTFEGLPLMVFPDAASDVEDLFSFMYMIRHIPHEILKVDTVDEVAGALRLSTKYDIEHLMARIVGVLESDWPKKLCDWDVREKYVNHLLIEKDGEDMDKYFAEPAALIRIATECNVLAVLPAAFYHLSRVYWRVQPSEGATGVSTGAVSAIARTAKVEILEAKDLRRLIVGREALRAEVLDFLYRVKRSRDEGHIATCKLTSKAEPLVWPCKKGLNDWWTNHALNYVLNCDKDDMHPINLYDPLASLTKLAMDITDWNFLSSAKRPCSTCRGWAANEILAERLKIWESLPRMFGIKDAWRNEEDSSSEGETNDDD